MLIIGHRGSSFAAPENTRASFALAWSEGADGVELDIQLTKDGHVVVCHDDNTFRTTGRDGLLSGMTLDELRLLDAGSWKSRRWSEERIPLLIDVLKETPPGKKVFVEVKCGREVLSALRRDIDRSGLRAEQVVFVGFSPDTMKSVKESFPGNRVLLNVERGTYGGRSAADVIARVRNLGLDGVGPGVKWNPDVEAIQLMLREGLEVFVWTVDRVAQARRLKDWGVQYLVTNKPGFLRKKLFARVSGGGE